jgi:hypothetical protein
MLIAKIKEESSFVFVFTGKETDLGVVQEPSS